jgi:hypothetical protein
MHIKNIEHNIIILHAKDILILIIKLKKHFNAFYIKIYFMATFTLKKQGSHIGLL